MNIVILGSSSPLGSHLCENLKREHFIYSVDRKTVDFTDKDWWSKISHLSDADVFIINFYDYQNHGAQENVFIHLWQRFRTESKTIVVMGSTAAYSPIYNNRYNLAKYSINRLYRHLSNANVSGTKARLILLEPSYLENHEKEGRPVLKFVDVKKVLDFALSSPMQFMQIQFGN